jgi:hypothetical protein
LKQQKYLFSANSKLSISAASKFGNKKKCHFAEADSGKESSKISIFLDIKQAFASKSISKKYSGVSV